MKTARPNNWGKNAAAHGAPKLAHFCAVARPPSEHLRIPPLWPSASVVAVARVLPHCNWPRTTRNPQSANAQYAIRPRTRASASPGSPRGNLQLPPRTLQSPWFWPHSGPKTLHAPSRLNPPWTNSFHTPLRGYENWGMKTGMKTGYENSMVGRCCPIRESFRTLFVTRPYDDCRNICGKRCSLYCGLQPRLRDPCGILAGNRACGILAGSLAGKRLKHATNRIIQ